MFPSPSHWTQQRVTSIEILYEDEDYIFIDKPYDLLINSDDFNNQNTVHRILSNSMQHANIDNLKHGFHFVNRLDYSTSGVMCLSKSKKGASLAGTVFQKRQAEKLYVALLRGHLISRSIDIDEPVGYDIRHLNGNKMMCTDKEFVLHSKESKTKIILLETGYLDDEEMSYVVLKPLTGRRHQLRVHCRHVGHPIVGDYTYSNQQDIKPHRMYLHALRLILPLPNRTITVVAPTDFVKDNWRRLKAHNTLNEILPSTNYSLI